jgi:rhamnose utilization protein RhaD (predicted bifunctional aldolase and dehydrogenase)
MVMPQHGYRDMGSSDFATWSDWIAAVNAAERYCAQLPKHRVHEYRFKCRNSDLPSCHPYWRMRVHRKAIKDADRHRANLSLILKKPSLMKVIYNKDMTLKGLKSMVRDLPKRRQDW